MNDLETLTSLGYTVSKVTPKTAAAKTATPITTAQEKDYVSIFQNIAAVSPPPEGVMMNIDWKKYALWGGIGAVVIGAIYWFKKK